MSTAFRSMSDLVADSEDLLGRIGRSESPQVRALLAPFRPSVDQLQLRLRGRAKQLRRQEMLATPGSQSRAARVIAAAFLTGCSVTWLCHVLKGHS